MSAELAAYFNYRAQSTLAGKMALVTGASSGIGLATACALAEMGVNLCLVARRLERLSALQELLGQRFPEISVQILQGDLSQSQTWDVMQSAGYFNCDILINNAGLALGREPVATSQFADWQKMIDLNITSAFEITRRALPHMLAQGEGDIVCLSSIAAHIPYEGGAIYCASKHALRAFCQVLRQETCGQNLRVIQISPGMVETEFSQVRFGDNDKAAAVYAGMTPLKPQDIAQQIIFALTQPRYLTLDEMIVMATDQGGPTKVVRH